MKKAILLSLSTIIAIVGIFYWWLLLSTLAKQRDSINWYQAQQQIITTCKTYPKSPINQDKISKDVDELFGSININRLIISNKKETSSPIKLNIGDGKKYCLAVWVGDITGTGTVAYKTTQNEVKTMSINNYPTP